MGLIDLGWVAHQAKAHCQKLTTKRPQKNAHGTKAHKTLLALVRFLPLVIDHNLGYKS